MTASDALDPRDGQPRTLHLSELLKRPLATRGGESLGRLSDVIVRLRGADLPVVTGLVATVGGRDVFVPIEQVTSLDGDPLRLASARLSLRRFERRDGEVLLRRDVLGHRLIDVERAHLIRAADLELESRVGDWVLTGVDTRRRARHLLGWGGPPGRDPAAHPFREWARFEPLIGQPAAPCSAAHSPGSAGSSRPRSRICSKRLPRTRRPRSSATCTPTRSWKRTCSRSSTRTSPPGCSAPAPTPRSPGYWPGCGPTTRQTPSPSCRSPAASPSSTCSRPASGPRC